MLGDGDIALRLLLAAALGGVIGVERELRDQPAGFRTHILLATGACLFALVSAYGFGDFIGRSSDAAVRVDVTRVASQVVVGVGFIGAGTILRYRGTVHGLTTAASLWVSAAVGLAVGLGFLIGALTASGIALLSLAALRPFKRQFRRGDAEPPE